MNSVINTDGRFIVVEGMDGAGKTELISSLALMLNLAGKTVINTVGIGGTPYGKALRNIWLDDKLGGTISKDSQLLMLMAARRDMIDKVVAPAIAAGHVVLCDRFHMTTYAYQHGAEQLELLMRMGSRGLVPDLTILLDVSYDVSRIRQMNSGKRMDHLDRATESVFNERRQLMLDYVHRNSVRENIGIVNAEQSAEEVYFHAKDMLKRALSQ